MKMNLTLIALAAAAVFDASDIGTSHSVTRDAGLGCSALMLKRGKLNERKELENDMIVSDSLVFVTAYNKKRFEKLGIIPTERATVKKLREVVNQSFNKFNELYNFIKELNISDVESVIKRAEAAYIAERKRLIKMESEIEADQEIHDISLTKFQKVRRTMFRNAAKEHGLSSFAKKNNKLYKLVQRQQKKKT
jgi:hypothetical protein